MGDAANHIPRLAVLRVKAILRAVAANLVRNERGASAPEG